MSDSVKDLRSSGGGYSWNLLIDEIETAVEEDNFNLTEWEDEFIQNLKTRDSLTERQDEVLEKIWKRATGK